MTLSSRQAWLSSHPSGVESQVATPSTALGKSPQPTVPPPHVTSIACPLQRNREKQKRDAQVPAVGSRHWATVTLVV